jgi:hypothetical protein
MNSEPPSRSSFIIHHSRYTTSTMTSFFTHIERTPIYDRVHAAVRRWQAFSETELGARLVPVYAALLGAALGALVADRLVRSMWRHAIFTGPEQWRTVAVILVLFWLVIGAVAALAALGPPDDRDAPDTNVRSERS